MATDFLTLEDLLEIAAGVLDSVEIRDAGLLESAVGRPRASAFGELAYPTLFDQAGALLHSLARNHALVDGNKRIAWAGARVFLILNGIELAYTVDDAEAFVLAVARGEMEVDAIAGWFRAHVASDGGR